MDVWKIVKWKWKIQVAKNELNISVLKIFRDKKSDKMQGRINEVKAKSKKNNKI